MPTQPARAAGAAQSFPTTGVYKVRRSYNWVVRTVCMLAVAAAAPSASQHCVAYTTVLAPGACYVGPLLPAVLLLPLRRC
jgi:hypothetical protein